MYRNNKKINYLTLCVVVVVVVVAVINCSYVNPAIVLSHLVLRHDVNTEIHIISDFWHRQRMSATFNRYLKPTSQITQNTLFVRNKL